MATDVDTSDRVTEHADSGEAPPMSGARRAAAAGLAIVVAMTALIGWLAYRDHRTQHAMAQREKYVDVGRQVALNLTTIDWAHAEADVQRILDSAAGAFHEEYAQRRSDFIKVVQSARSKTEGTVIEAGVESEAEGRAVVMVVASVRSSAGDAEGKHVEGDETQRQWRMRITLEHVGDDVKATDVEFIS